MREKKPSKYIRHEGFATGGRVVSDEEFEILQNMKWQEEKETGGSVPKQVLVQEGQEELIIKEKKQSEYKRRLIGASTLSDKEFEKILQTMSFEDLKNLSFQDIKKISDHISKFFGKGISCTVGENGPELIKEDNKNG